MRLLILAWKIWQGALPTFSNLRAHHLRCDVGCAFCGFEDDIVDHVFLMCDFARAVWFGLSVSVRSCNMRFHNIQRWFRFWISMWKKRRMLNYEDWLIMLVGLDVIWKLQNDRIRRNTMVSLFSLFIKLIAQLNIEIHLIVRLTIFVCL